MRILSLLAVLFATALLAGCGGSSATDTGDLKKITNLAQIADATADANSGRFELKLGITTEGLPERFSISGGGAFDSEAKQAQFDLDLSSFGELLGGLLSGFGGDAAKGIDFADPDGWKISVVAEGDKAYLRVPLLDSQLDGKKWIALDAKSLSGTGGTGFDAAQLEKLTKQTPKEILGLLGKIAGDLEDRGQEEIRGEATTHYHATIEIAKVAALIQEHFGQQAGGSPLDVAELVEQLKQEAGITEIPLDLWLGADNLPRRIAIDLQITADSEQGSLTLGLDMFDWGQAIDIDVPDASETIDSSALEKLAGGIFGGLGSSLGSGSAPATTGTCTTTVTRADGTTTTTPC